MRTTGNPARLAPLVLAGGLFAGLAAARLVQREWGSTDDEVAAELPGDRILVMSKPDSTWLPFIRDLTQTIFQMAGVFVAIDRL